MISRLKKIPDLIIVDDHLIFRQGLKSIITIENIATVIGEASDGAQFIELLSSLRPELVLIDIDMPIMNGVEATQKALELMPDLKIIVFTMFEDFDYYRKMISLGVKGFILKTSGFRELEKAIQCVTRGECYFPGDLTQKMTCSLNNNNTNESLANNSLTAEETELYKLICLGLTNDEIGRILLIRPSSVKRHRSLLLEKIGSMKRPDNSNKNSDYWLS
jgi:DNA-binding NarL/FixJ family response regulator